MRFKRLWLTVCLLCAFAANALAGYPNFADFSEKYAEKFSLTGAEWTENGYRSPNIALEIKVLRQDNSDVYVADIYVRSVEYLQRAFGSENWGRGSKKVATMAQEHNAILAITGDNAQHLKAGYITGNGEVFRDRGNNVRDLCVIYTDGTMQTHYAKADHDLINQQVDDGLVWQSFVFGPALLDAQGKALTVFPNSDVNSENPRAVIGYYEPGHFCLVQIDGRGTASAVEEKKTNKGMTLEQTAALMESLGCTAAYNLDGGQSALMWYKDGILSTPYHGGRAVGDVIILCDDAAMLPAAEETEEVLDLSDFEVTE